MHLGGEEAQLIDQGRRRQQGGLGLGLLQQQLEQGLLEGEDEARGVRRAAAGAGPAVTQPGEHLPQRLPGRGLAIVQRGLVGSGPQGLEDGGGLPAPLRALRGLRSGGELLLLEREPAIEQAGLMLREHFGDPSRGIHGVSAPGSSGLAAAPKG